MVFVSKVDSVNGTEKADWMGAGLSQFFTKKTPAATHQGPSKETSCDT
jgi:hypothetical protein